MEPVRFPPFATALAADRMTWWPEPGVGYLPIRNPAPYDAAYFDRYAQQAATDIGRALMAIRANQVQRVMKSGVLCDVGIGCGAFVEEMLIRYCQRAAGTTPAVRGYDVNPEGVTWLRRRGVYHSPYAAPVDAVSLWDVLEHIPDFAPLLSQVRKFVFISIPIFRSPSHARYSKHYRPDEHCWYFTHNGLVATMEWHGFKFVECHSEEVAAGREDVESFTFIRR
jgi:hypothetical protein